MVAYSPFVFFGQNLQICGLGKTRILGWWTRRGGPRRGGWTLAVR